MSNLAFVDLQMSCQIWLTPGWPPLWTSRRYSARSMIREMTKDPEVKGSRTYQSSVTLPFRGTKAPKTLVLLWFGAIREGRMIRDRSLLTSRTLDFRVPCRRLNDSRCSRKALVEKLKMLRLSSCPTLLRVTWIGPLPWEIQWTPAEPRGDLVEPSKRPPQRPLRTL